MSKKENTLIKIFLLFLIISTFLDFHIFYNSISTLIRAIIISILFLIVLIKNGTFKEKRNLFIYSFIIIIYIIAHHLNALSFKSLVPGDFHYNLIKEILYFYKMSTNILLFYIVYKLNINYKNIKNVLKIIVFIITFSIIITDLFGISYTAYNFNKTTIPIYKWFNLQNYDFIYGSSKGLFHMTNQLVAILLLYLPITLYEAFKEKKITTYVLTLMIVVSMLMIGNRLAIYGTILELSAILILYFIINKEKKKNIGYYIFNSLLILMIIFIIPKSPLMQRDAYYEAIYNNKSLDFMQDNNHDVYDEYEEDERIEQKFKDKEIDPQFAFSSYPYKYDKKFWNDILTEDSKITGNARYIELAMTKRVKEINNNSWDSVLGLTYTRVMNIFNIEQDFIMQYYSIGILGMIIFLGLYFILFIYILIKIIYDFKHKFNYLNISLLMGTSCLFLSSYFSGNLLNSISIIIPFTLVLSVLVNEIRVKKKQNKKEEILGFSICTDNKDKLLDQIFKNDDQLFIVNINPLIALNYYHNAEIKALINKEKIVIPDGEGIVLVSKLKGGNIEKRITGIDLMLAICEKAASQNKTIYLYGAKEGVAIKVKETLEKNYSKIKIVGWMNGFEKQDKVIKDIKNKKPDIVFVGLGSPLQEEFIIKNKSKLKDVKIFMPVGGSFDVISGNLKRAPKIIQAIKLEWLYRMFKEPKRFKGIIKLIQFIIIGIFYHE